MASSRLRSSVGRRLVLSAFLALVALLGGGHGCAHRPPPGVAPPAAEPPAFVVLPLGVAGGLREDNLSSYLLASPDGATMIAFDAGTLRTGLERAVANGVFAPGGALELAVPAAATADVASWVLRERLSAYLVSHAHLDHYAGLVLNSPDDGPSSILGLDPTVDALRDHLFNGTVWGNFADEGAQPLARYRYVRLPPGEEKPLAATGWTVEAHPLAHAGGTSTAFLVRSGEAAIVYLGDTGPDAVEASDALGRLWDRLAPLVRSGALRAVLIEVSYPSERPDDRLFGHLTPRWLGEELRRLAERVAPGDPQALGALTVVVTHVKPLPGEPFAASRERIRRQLAAVTAAGVRFVLPEQGVPLAF